LLEYTKIERIIGWNIITLLKGARGSKYKLNAADQGLTEHPESINKKPLNVLNANLNKPTYIKLKNGLSYRGVLDKADSQMNVILQGAVEYNDGNDGGPSVSLGMVLIRGNNILYIRVGDFLE